MKRRSGGICVLLFILASLATAQQPKPYRLPSVDLKQRVIWGSEATTPEGLKLKFGGLDQAATLGTPTTEILIDGTPVDAHFDDRLLKLENVATAVSEINGLQMIFRKTYFNAKLNSDPAPLFDIVSRAVGVVGNATESAIKSLDGNGKSGTGDYTDMQLKRASAMLVEAAKLLPKPNNEVSGEAIRKLQVARELAERADDCLRTQPPPRALSPLVYDPHTQLFVVFGGDHLDHLTNDLWIFDAKTKEWQARYPEKSPPPRANHKWEVLPGGKLKLTGGYTYFSNTDYMGGQYIDINDGAWIYDIAANKWTGTGKMLESATRTYRTGPFHPDFFTQGEKPDAAAFQKKLAELPANTWVATKPLHKPELNRDWGTAVLTPDNDLMLRWSGGHCAHCGTDVLQYHLRTNRWELTAPVEFPLGQLYTNTEYPAGVSFNGGAWITGHTYQSYACDPKTGHMWFVGQRKQAFRYLLWAAQWQTTGFDKPKGMNYDSCFYTLTLCTIPSGIACWTNEGRMFHLPAGKTEWTEWKLTGDKLPGSQVDNSTLAYDAKRDRLVFFRKEYGDDKRYDGVLHSLDLKSKAVTKLTPDNAAAASKISYLCQIRYDAVNDLLLCGCTLPPDESGLRRTPAYDPAKNQWVSLKITGDDPSGPKGRNVSLGMQYDDKRKLFLATDTHCEVYVLRLDAAQADVQALK